MVYCIFGLVSSLIRRSESEGDGFFPLFKDCKEATIIYIYIHNLDKYLFHVF